MKTQKQTTEYVRQWKKRHRKEGLCTYCVLEALEGTTMCTYHRDYFRKYKKAHKTRYERYTKSGVV